MGRCCLRTALRRASVCGQDRDVATHRCAHRRDAARPERRRRRCVAVDRCRLAARDRCDALRKPWPGQGYVFRRWTQRSGDGVHARMGTEFAPKPRTLREFVHACGHSIQACPLPSSSAGFHEPLWVLAGALLDVRWSQPDDAHPIRECERRARSLPARWRARRRPLTGAARQGTGALSPPRMKFMSRTLPAQSARHDAQPNDLWSDQ